MPDCILPECRLSAQVVHIIRSQLDVMVPFRNRLIAKALIISILVL